MAEANIREEEEIFEVDVSKETEIFDKCMGDLHDIVLSKYFLHSCVNFMILQGLKYYLEFRNGGELQVISY